MISGRLGLLANEWLRGDLSRTDAYRVSRFASAARILQMNHGCSDHPGA